MDPLLAHKSLQHQVRLALGLEDARHTAHHIEHFLPGPVPDLLRRAVAQKVPGALGHGLLKELAHAGQAFDLAGPTGWTGRSGLRWPVLCRPILVLPEAASARALRVLRAWIPAGQPRGQCIMERCLNLRAHPRGYPSKRSVGAWE